MPLPQVDAAFTDLPVLADMCCRNAYSHAPDVAPSGPHAKPSHSGERLSGLSEFRDESFGRPGG